MKISLVISTNNRAKPLKKLLKALPLQNTQPDELIIVVGPDFEKTVDMLNSHAFPVNVHHCPDHNLSKSRNIGLSCALGDIAVFMDDDAIPLNQDWLDHLIEGFSIDESLSAAGGGVLIRDTDKYEFDQGSSTINEYGQTVSSVTKASGELLSAREYNRVQGCNCAFRISHLKQVGGFDEWYDYYHDETDLVLRLHKAGFTVRFVDNAVVRHFSRVDDFTNPLHRRYWLKTARSDAYCMVKNAPQRGFLDVLRILLMIRRRYYSREVKAMHHHNLINRLERFLLEAKLVVGWVQGFYRGLFRKRRCPL